MAGNDVIYSRAYIKHLAELHALKHPVLYRQRGDENLSILCCFVKGAIDFKLWIVHLWMS